MGEDSDRNIVSMFTGGSILFIGLIFKQGFAFLAKLVIARGLGRVDYGAVSLGVTVMSVLSLFALFGLHSGVSRFLPRYESTEERRGVLLSAFQLSLPVSILFGVLVAVYSDTIATVAFHDPSIGPIIRVFGFIIPLSSIIQLSIGGIRGVKVTKPKAYIEYLSLPAARFAFTAIALFLGYRALGIAWAYFFAYLFAAAIAVYFLVQHTSIAASVSPETMHWTLLTFSFPLVISAAMNLVLSDIDTFILGYYWELAQVGIYNVIYPLGQVISTSITAFSYLFLPIISDLESNQEYGQMNRIYAIGTKWIFLVTFPMFVPVAVFPQTVISLTFGAEYAPGGTALTVLAVGFTIHAIVGLNSTALTAMGNTKLIMYDNVFVAIVNLVLNFLLIPEYSYLGAAVATSISYIILNGLYSYQLYEDAGVFPVNKGLYRTGALSLVLGAALFAVSEGVQVTLPVFLGLLAAFTVLYLLIVLHFGINEAEEGLILTHLEDQRDVDLTVVRKYLF